MTGDSTNLKSVMSCLGDPTLTVLAVGLQIRPKERTKEREVGSDP